MAEDVVNVYSIYDRLLAHWSPPYFNHSTKEFLSGLSQAINKPEQQSPIALKPDHFSVWQIGQIDSGYITNIDRHLVAECNTLVRTGLRPPDQRTGETLARSEAGQHHPPGQPPRPTGALQRAPARQVQATDRQGAQAPAGPGSADR